VADEKGFSMPIFEAGKSPAVVSANLPLGTTKNPPPLGGGFLIRRI